MKFIFIVQGEGRGHMTQAITLFHLLKNAGHEVPKVIVGKSRRRKLPDFFINQISSEIVQLPSPNFVTDRKNQSVDMYKSFVVNIAKTSIFLNSIRKIHKLVKQERPDAIINFYDFLGGFYFLFRRPKVKHIALAHQYLSNHKDFEFPRGRIYDKRSMFVANYIASFRASKRLALSFQHFEDEPQKKLFITPPLLRDIIKKQEVIEEDHFLVYMVNHGYSKQVEKFHKKHPDIKIHCFWDKKKMPKEMKVDDRLIFHQLDEKKFITLMASCKAYLTTAGFESVCEAMYMGKPILMVPVKGHYEQSCNAIDAKRAGAGISSDVFNLELLSDYIPNHKNIGSQFKHWSDKAEKTFLKHLTEDVN